MRHGASLPGGSGNAPVSVMLTRRSNGECAFYTPLALRSQLLKAFRGSYMIPLLQVFKTIADMHAQKSRRRTELRLSDADSHRLIRPKLS
jgi:hypothetical protein